MDINDYMQVAKDVSYAGFAAYTGIKNIELKDGYAIGEVDLEPKHMNPIGSIHGGMVFTMADTIAGLAAFTSGGVCTTVNSSISYINPTMNANKIICEANVIKTGRSLIHVEANLMDQDKKMFAKASLCYFRLGDKVNIDLNK